MFMKLCQVRPHSTNDKTFQIKQVFSLNALSDAKLTLSKHWLEIRAFPPLLCWSTNTLQWECALYSSFPMPVSIIIVFEQVYQRHLCLTIQCKCSQMQMQPKCIILLIQLKTGLHGCVCDRTRQCVLCIVCAVFLVMQRKTWWTVWNLVEVCWRTTVINIPDLFMI